jgi:hypothetical protein
VYDAVQEASKRVPGLKREQVFAGVKTPALGADLTSVTCKGVSLPLGITVDPISGLALTIDALTAEDSQTLKDWIEPIAKRVGAQVLVTDDADGFKTVADEVGVQHQVCKAHVLRNTEDLIDKYQPLVACDADGSLKAIGVSPQQAAADLTRLGELVKSRQREQATELEALHRRYLQASPPREGGHQSLAYRLRLLFLDRWNLWHRLTRCAPRHAAMYPPKIGEELEGGFLGHSPYLELKSEGNRSMVRTRGTSRDVADEWNSQDPHRMAKARLLEL